MKNYKERWVVVLDDSDCTVGVGGEGYLWKVNTKRVQHPTWLFLEGVSSPYPKSIFRDATEDEIKAWKKNKQYADVPKHNKPKLYENLDFFFYNKE